MGKVATPGTDVMSGILGGGGGSEVVEGALPALRGISMLPLN